MEINWSYFKRLQLDWATLRIAVTTWCKIRIFFTVVFILWRCQQNSNEIKTNSLKGFTDCIIHRCGQSASIVLAKNNPTLQIQHQINIKYSLWTNEFSEEKIDACIIRNYFPMRVDWFIWKCSLWKSFQSSVRSALTAQKCLWTAGL